MSAELGVVENLVTQFSSAMDCMRELVQNSIDAGSPQIEVWMEYERSASDELTGVIAIHVDDFGEGMDEAIIDSQFTTLFASAKENDLTKIGKFGIGFVSVFALKPKGVLVHTGRAGEYWEVFFHEDRSFSKTRLDYPVEGTQITLFLEGDPGRYRELVREAFSTLKHWCRHSETEISFEDRSADGTGRGMHQIVEPFEVEGLCPLRVEHQGTEIVLAYTHKTQYGFYNRGLALAFSAHGEDLLFERTPRYRHISFKIKSRYLEHTLSRETIVRDVNYEKAMQLIDEAADGPLLDALGEALSALCALPRWRQEHAAHYWTLLEILVNEPNGSLTRLEQRPVMRALTGEGLALAQVLAMWERDGRLLWSTSESALVGMLKERGVLTLYGAPHTRSDLDGGGERARVASALFTRYARHTLGRRPSALVRDTVGANPWFKQTKQLIKNASGSTFFERTLQRSPVVRLMTDSLLDNKTRVELSMESPDKVYLSVELSQEFSEEVKTLVRSAGALLQAADTGYKGVTTCRMASAAESPPLFVIAPTLSSLMAIPPAEVRLRGDMQVAVNCDHPHLRYLARQYVRRPALASYCLAKALLLQEDRMLERDARLIQLAMASQP